MLDIFKAMLLHMKHIRISYKITGWEETFTNGPMMHYIKGPFFIVMAHTKTTNGHKHLQLKWFVGNQ